MDRQGRGKEARKSEWNERGKDRKESKREGQVRER